MIKIILIIYGLCSFFAFIRFFIDVGKWHKQEKHVKIIPSGDKVVISDERADNNSNGDYNGNNSYSDRDSGSGAGSDPGGRSERGSSWNISANG